jgi:hypothetical protein
VAASTTYATPARVRRFRGIDRLPAALAWAALAALGLWALAPIVYLLAKAAVHHESLSGGESLFAADQLQYLAWIRSSGEHVFAGNGFALRLGGDVFLHPMFAISALLWRAGLNIALSYLLWLPVAVGVLYVGFRQFVFRTIASPLARSAALILALFFVTPLDPLVGWTVGSNDLGVFAGELAPTGALYGYFPVVIAVGLSALFMLGLQPIIDLSRRRRSLTWYLAWTCVTGALISWLHPWQGETALVVIAAMLAVGRLRKAVLPLLIPAVATALPLGYYVLLSRIDGAWRLAQFQSAPPRPNTLLLLVALAPLALPAIPALRVIDRRDAILWLWPLAALIVYFVSPGYAVHALEGIALPLSVLAVRGWQAVRWPRWLAAVAIAVSTLPGLVFNVHLFHLAAVSDPEAMLLRGGETEALAYLSRTPVPGGVLPSLRISAAVPAYTGRRAWIGHASWSPHYFSRIAAVSALFSGRMSGSAGRSFLRSVGARYLLADCEPGFNPTWLGPLLVSERRFGCVRVYELAVPNRAKPL